MLRFIKPLGVGTINHIDEYVSVVKVVPPVRSDLPLPPDVPHIELEALTLHALDVEALDAKIKVSDLIIRAKYAL